MTPDELVDEDQCFEEEDDDDPVDCHGSFDRGRFWCGKAGSEECDFECPYSRWIGLTKKQIDALED